jgi:hypothetical protein
MKGSFLVPLSVVFVLVASSSLAAGCSSDDAVADDIPYASGSAGKAGTAGTAGSAAAGGGGAGSGGDGGSVATYPCPGPLGEAGAGGEAGTGSVQQSLCVVGQSYCGISLSFEGAIRSAGCDNAVPTECANDPSCGCICSHGGRCITECSCQDADGFARITCGQI